MAKKSTPQQPASRKAAPAERFAAASGRHRIAPRGREAGLKASVALRAMLEELSKRFAANETRLRSQLRHLQRQVSEQARQIQALSASGESVAPAAAVEVSTNSRAGRALNAMRGRLADQASLPAQASEDARRRWVNEGLLVPTATLVEAWGVSRQALDQARERGDLIGLKVANRQYYPADFLGLAAEDVAQVCRALAGVDAVSGVLFWSRKHGSLNDQTLAEELKAKGLAAVVRLAEGFADEAAGVQSAAEKMQSRAIAA